MILDAVESDHLIEEVVDESVDRFRIVAQVLVDHVVETVDRIVQVDRWIDHHRLLEVEALLLRIESLTRQRACRPGCSRRHSSRVMPISSARSSAIMPMTR